MLKPSTITDELNGKVALCCKGVDGRYTSRDLGLVLESLHEAAKAIVLLTLQGLQRWSS